jgi:hypothetical protein
MDKSQISATKIMLTEEIMIIFRVRLGLDSVTGAGAGGVVGEYAETGTDGAVASCVLEEKDSAGAKKAFLLSPQFSQNILPSVKVAPHLGQFM